MTVRAALKELHSPDVFDLTAYSPSDPANFSFLLQAMYGPAGAEGAESFDIVVCTPAWLENNDFGGPIQIGLHHLIVRYYSYPEIKQFLEDYGARCEGRDWTEVAEKLGRIGKWEFQDYQHIVDPTTR